MNSPVLIHASAPNILVRLLWFVFFGWWLGGLVSAFAWLCVLSVLGLPLGLWLIDRLPAVITLRPQGGWRVEDGALVAGVPQLGLLPRALYFLLVGWWLSGIWLAIAYLALISVLLIPLSFWMYGRVAAVTTLYRS